VYHCFRNFTVSEVFFLSVSRYDLLTLLVSAHLIRIKDLLFDDGGSVKYDLIDI
jgi:hypothetical protein